MFGAIAGDVIGSTFELVPTKSKQFELFDEASRFTDDTVLTIATAEAILHGVSFRSAYLDFGRRYPHAGYGASFGKWLRAENPEPYGSLGNGSAMRVSPVGFAYDDEGTVLEQAELSAAVSHNHPDGVRGAQAVALGVFLARTGASKTEIGEVLSSRFGYDLKRTIARVRPDYSFDVTCSGSVPEAILAFLESHDFEDAIRLAVSLGGDSDTQAAIAGALAQAYYKRIPDDIANEVRKRLPDQFVAIVDEFQRRYPLISVGH
jgi:ADP-ribosylglycohydrolase